MTDAAWILVSPVAPAGHPERKVHSGPRPPITTLGFLSNRKHNTEELQRLLGQRLVAAHPDLKLRFYEKPNSAAGADFQLLEVISKEVQIVINGTGD